MTLRCIHTYNGMEARLDLMQHPTFSVLAQLKLLSFFNKFYLATRALLSSLQPSLLLLAALDLFFRTLGFYWNRCDTTIY